MSMPLEGILGPEKLKALRALIDVLIPRTGDAPSGVEAGVLEYLQNALVSHHSAHTAAYSLLLAGLSRRAWEVYQQPYERLSADDAVAVARQVESQLPGHFVLVRNHCFEGYFAHPRWREDRGPTIWSAAGFKPVLRNSDQFGHPDASPPPSGKDGRSE